MGAVLLVIALIAAGVVTGETGFYYVAGTLVGLYVVAVVTLAVATMKRVRSIERDFGLRRRTGGRL